MKNYSIRMLSGMDWRVMRIKETILKLVSLTKQSMTGTRGGIGYYARVETTRRSTSWLI